MLVSVNIPITNRQRSERFYKHLMGERLGKHPFARDALSVRGLRESFVLTMFPRQDPKETTLCYFQVPALKKAIDELKKLGGSLLVEPFSITFERNGKSDTRQAAILADPDGNGVGLVSQA